MREESYSSQDLHLLHDLTRIGKSFFLPVTTLLQVEVDGIITKMNSVAVGYSRDEYLIIKYPSARGLGPINHKFTKGAKLTVRYIAEGNVFAFQSEVIAIINDFRLVLITYPTLIARHNLRNLRRIECYLPAALQPLRARLHLDNTVVMDTVYQGIIVDINQSGCNFEMVEDSQFLPDISIEDPVLLYLTLPGTEEKKEIRGRVKRIHRDARRMGTGIQFDEIGEDVKRLLTDYISVIERLILTE